MALARIVHERCLTTISREIMQIKQTSMAYRRRADKLSLWTQLEDFRFSDPFYYVRTGMVGGNALPDVLPSMGRTKVRSFIMSAPFPNF